MDSKADYPAIRKSNLAQLNAAGFVVAGNLPIGPHSEADALRPANELAERLWASAAVYLYVAESEKKAPKSTIRECVVRHDLLRSMEERDRKRLHGWRWLSYLKHVDKVGWLLENMLALSWILGFDANFNVDGVMVGGDRLDRMLFEFIGDLGQDLPAWTASRVPRSEREVIVKEDLFYCAHNATTSAQLGRPTVPQGFGPIAGGNVIQERRHALTWAISPGVRWKDTDLNT